MSNEDDDPICDISGRCIGVTEDRGRGECCCQSCGKTLLYLEGAWRTWDAVAPDWARQDEEPRWEAEAV